MNQHVSIPGWDDFSVQLKEDLNYSETMLELLWSSIFVTLMAKKFTFFMK